MPTILPTKSIYFNDVVLIQGIGVVKSRKEVPRELYRLIVSPMPSVVGERFTVEAAKNGLSLCIPRLIDKNHGIDYKIKLNKIFNENATDNRQKCFIGIGPNEDVANLKQLNKTFKHRINILCDMAHGTIPQLGYCLQRIAKYVKIDTLLVGNIMSDVGYKYIVDNILINRRICSNLIIRCGVGNGKVCATYDMTGVNRGSITELMEIFNFRYKYGAVKADICSDGGISKSGYAMLAFGAGADYVMIGSYFAKAQEAETNVIGDGTVWGCASDKQNKLSNLNKHSEGKVNNIEKSEIRPLAELVDEFWGGLSSGVSYTGYGSLSRFIGNGLFEIKQNSLPPKKRY